MKRPTPKQKRSKLRTHRQYGTFVAKARKKLSDTVALTTCKECGAARLAHTVCKECGMYRGKKVLATNRKKNAITTVKA